MNSLPYKKHIGVNLIKKSRGVMEGHGDQKLMFILKYEQTGFATNNNICDNCFVIIFTSRHKSLNSIFTVQGEYANEDCQTSISSDQAARRNPDMTGQVCSFPIASNLIDNMLVVMILISFNSSSVKKMLQWRHPCLIPADMHRTVPILLLTA